MVNRNIYLFFLLNFSTTFMLRFYKTAAYVAQHIRFFPLVEAWVVFGEFDCVMILVMVICDQPDLAFVYYDCLFSDQVLDVREKHGMVRFHLECTHIKIEVKKVGCSCYEIFTWVWETGSRNLLFPIANPAGSFTPLFTPA